MIVSSCHGDQLASGMSWRGCLCDVCSSISWFLWPSCLGCWCRSLLLIGHWEFLEAWKIQMLNFRHSRDTFCRVGDHAELDSRLILLAAQGSKAFQFSQTYLHEAGSSDLVLLQPRLQMVSVDHVAKSTSCILSLQHHSDIGNLLLWTWPILYWSQRDSTMFHLSHYPRWSMASSCLISLDRHFGRGSLWTHIIRFLNFLAFRCWSSICTQVFLPIALMMDQ